jgi:DNA-binding LacI/PurR family transcriptional regulator
MPTVRDVAKKVSIAPITVSRESNNSGYDSQSTRMRVDKAIEELGHEIS